MSEESDMTGHLKFVSESHYMESTQFVLQLEGLAVGYIVGRFSRVACSSYTTE
jgi:hypothetical protein